MRYIAYLFIFVLALQANFIFTDFAYSFSCGSFSTLDGYASSDAVFTGKVLATKTIRESSSGPLSFTLGDLGEYSTTFKVVEAFKGVDVGSEVTVKFEGVIFTPEAGGTPLIFADGGRELMAGPCYSAIAEGESSALQILRNLNSPKEVSNDYLLPSVLAGLLIACFGYLGYSRLKSKK